MVWEKFLECKTNAIAIVLTMLSILSLLLYHFGSGSCSSIIRTAFELKKGMTWMVLALISSAVATTMKTFWDIVIDWGLLRRHSKNKYMRDKLLVSLFTLT